MSNPILVVIIGAVVDTRNLTLYKEDGSTLLIPQGDPRLQGILDTAMAGLKNMGDKVTIDLTEQNHFADFEKKTGGLVRLFKVAKSKVAEFFNKTEAKPTAPITLGIIPTAKDVPAMTAVVTRKVAPLESAVAEIMSHATPVAAPEFKEPKADCVAEPDTMIAVVDGKVIPEVAALKPQMAAATLTPNASTKGMEAFLKRLSAVIGLRRHSVEDLMKFLAKGDLPIADDGSIVIYKILKRVTGKPGVFVDCHTKKIEQKVGSYVHMEEGLVDPDRRQDCSNGLHVASRSYLSSFSGDVIVLAKVAPEDVFAVPEYNTNKMRVCGYHIIAELSGDTFKKLRSNKPMTDNITDQAILGRALTGDHIGITEKVKIGGHYGANVTVTPVGMAARTVMVDPAPRLAEALPENGYVAPAVDVKEVAKAVTKAKEETPPPAPLTPAEAGIDVVTKADVGIGKLPAEAKPVKKLGLKDEAYRLYKLALSATDLNDKQLHAMQLVEFKKAKKKSWTDLGLQDTEVKFVTTLAEGLKPQKGAIFTNEATIAKAEKKTNKATDVAAGFPKKAPHNDDKMLPSVNQHDLHFKALNGDKAAGVQLAAWQKAKKKGWAALGFPADTKEMLAKLAE